MKGLISNQNGPKLEEILRLFAQSDTPTNVTLRGFGHPGSASLNLKDGRMINITCGDVTGNQALQAVLSFDSWHFETSPDLQSVREDFSGNTDVAMQVVGMRAEMQAQRAEAEVDARRSRTFTIVNERSNGQLTPPERQKLDEEYTFFSYYALELGSTLGLGAIKSISFSEADRSIAMKQMGNQWNGVFTHRQSSITQLLSEIV